MTLAETEAEVERIASAAHQSGDDDRDTLRECISTARSLVQIPPTAINPPTDEVRNRALVVMAKALSELRKLNGVQR